MMLVFGLGTQGVSTPWVPQCYPLGQYVTMHWLAPVPVITAADASERALEETRSILNSCVSSVRPSFVAARLQ